MHGEVITEVTKLALDTTKPFEVNGRTYSAAEFREIKQVVDYPDSLAIYSLSGMVDFVKGNKDGIKPKDLTVIVVDHEHVTLLGAANSIDKQRPTYMKSKLDYNSFDFDRWTDHEEFMIALLTKFKDNAARKILIDKVSSVQEISESKAEETGCSTNRYASNKIAIKGDQKEFVLDLQPFRTFTEAEQPTSQFIFRIKNGKQCILMDCDGGAWKNAARKAIKEYLVKAMPEGVSVIA